MKITIDDHEDRNRRKLIKNFFGEEKCEVKRLETGDIIIEQENKPTIAIEVKTVEDFISSIKNKRIHDEVLRMKKKYPYSYIICYGDWRRLNPKFYKYTAAEKYSNIFSLTTVYKVPFFWVDTEHDFLMMIHIMAKNIDRIGEPIDPPIVRNKSNNPFINVLIGIDGVGEKTAKRLLDKFYTPGGVFAASEEELREVPRLSKKSIKEILRMKYCEEE